MDKDTILAMKPGRELDALVAEKVMGWKPYDINGVYWSHKYQVDSIYDKRFSTDIAAAWEVWLKMRDKLLFNQRRNFMFALQEVISREKSMTTDLIAWPDVAWFITPEAICKAALLSLE